MKSNAFYEKNDFSAYVDSDAGQGCSLAQVIEASSRAHNLSKFSLKDIENKEFILHHHLGLGDSIVCNGMVNYLSKDFKKIYLPVKDNNYKTIKFLYSENNRVEIFKVENETRENDVSNFANNNNLEILRVGFKNVGDTPFNKAFYKQLNLPYKYSIKYF